MAVFRGDVDGVGGIVTQGYRVVFFVQSIFGECLRLAQHQLFECNLEKGANMQAEGIKAAASRLGWSLPVMYNAQYGYKSISGDGFKARLGCVPVRFESNASPSRAGPWQQSCPEPVLAAAGQIASSLSRPGGCRPRSSSGPRGPGHKVAGHADDALDAVLAREEGDAVEDEVADADAAAPAGGHVGGDPVAIDGEGGQHGGPLGSGDLDEVGEGEVGEAGDLERREGEAEGVAEEVGEEGHAGCYAGLHVLAYICWLLYMLAATYAGCYGRGIVGWRPG
ncbi:hypothetical protein TOPH_08657 [Tolypocladium ophioglossoides CBS 100239]|uniref:Uncharacterized protein n=1 Tax=Tolypocladium ophioglossoides (strain CBS 100239) TaxID=1163406 RepID=A0A0L0MYX5_TOLOC|nr:hypothetical protein TOPH_08657 [Tolypocladium ophioglossoides CBS 100239]